MSILCLCVVVVVVVIHDINFHSMAYGGGNTLFQMLLYNSDALFFFCIVRKSCFICTHLSNVGAFIIMILDSAIPSTLNLFFYLLRLFLISK